MAISVPNILYVIKNITIGITTDITNSINIGINSIDIDIDINNVNIDINIDINIDVNIDVKIENIENVCLSVNDRNNIRMSPDFACEHLLDPRKMMRSSEINEIAKINRFHRFFDRSKTI